MELIPPIRRNFGDVAKVLCTMFHHILPPEIPKPIRCHLGVAHGVLDILMAKVVLQRSRVVSVVGELVSRRAAACGGGCETASWRPPRAAG
jgi:hypothetical protein